MGQFKRGGLMNGAMTQGGPRQRGQMRGQMDGQPGRDGNSGMRAQRFRDNNNHGPDGGNQMRQPNPKDGGSVPPPPANAN